MAQIGWINLDGVVNMRDLGGLPTRDGGRVQPRRLIRSDNLQDLSPNDVEQVVQVLGVTDIVDLRSETELSFTGPGPLRQAQSLTHHHHSLLGDSNFTVSDALLLRTQGDHGLDQDAALWTSSYLAYLNQRGDSVAAALAVIAGASGAVIVHCAAGKDRTGTVTAMALDVAGVLDDHIAADYAATAQRLPEIMARLSKTGLYAQSLATQTVADQEAKPETMLALLQTVRAQFGGAGGWLQAQGWSADDVAQLRKRLTA